MASRQASLAADRLLPVAMLMVAVLIDLLPLPAPAPQTLAPLVSLATLYAWALHRPDRLGPTTAFLAGLALDLGGDLPPGVTALPFLLVQVVVASPRESLRDLAPFAHWGIFLAVAAGACLLRWLLISLCYGAVPPFRPALFELALTVAVYPLLAGLIGRTRVAQAQRHAPGF
jgi:rod shape-determining protein MreD